MSRSHSGNSPDPPPARVLRIEDHPVLRQLLSDLLVQDGYHVTCAAPAPPPEPFDIVLTDWLVPGLDVRSFIETQLAAHGDCACVVMSGYPVPLEQFPADLRPRLRYLGKPFTAAQLRQSLRALRELQLVGGQVR